MSDCDACDEVRDALTEAAQHMGLDPDGLDDLAVIRAMTDEYDRLAAGIDVPKAAVDEAGAHFGGSEYR